MSRHAGRLTVVGNTSQRGRPSNPSGRLTRPSGGGMMWGGEGWVITAWFDRVHCPVYSVSESGRGPRQGVALTPLLCGMRMPTVMGIAGVEWLHM